MTTWDVFHTDRLEVERGLTTADVRAAIARGDILDDDLIRPAGSADPWARLFDMPALFEPEPASLEAPAAPSAAASSEPFGEYDLNLRRPAVELPDRDESPSSVEILAWDDNLDEEEYDPQEEDEAVAEFTLSRGSSERVEELDLAAMVDVAFQLVLFFLVTATTIVYKSLEVPKPNPESNQAAAAQGRSKTLDELKDSFILVEIDPLGAVKIDHEPVVADLSVLVERLRAERQRTDRKAMLLSADFATPHKNAVLAYDAANEIGLGIAIARPSANPTPAPPPAPKAGVAEPF